MQASVERMLLDRVDNLPPKVSMAVLVMDNDSLEIKAYAGSADFSDDSRYAHVDMVRGVRSPGSTLKPFLYAQALDEGLIHSESLLIDAPLSFGGYAPGNFQAAFSGPISVAQALQRSLNVPAVDLLDRVGPVSFASVMLAGGVRLRLPAGAEPNLSLILGGGGTTLEELVGAYRALARGGLSGRPRLRPEQPRVESRMMSAGAAWIVRDILESGGHPDRPFYESGNQGRRLAWKTGTSFGFRDAWSVGVTDRWTIGVWVGRPDGTPIRAFSAPMWRRRCCRTSSRPCRKARRNPDPARHGASRRDVLAAGLPVGQRPDRRLPRAARGLGPERHGAAVLRRLRRRHQGRCAWAASRPGRCCGPCRAAGRWRWTWTRRAPKVRYGGCWMAGSLIMARRLIRLN